MTMKKNVRSSSSPSRRVVHRPCTQSPRFVDPEKQRVVEPDIRELARGEKAAPAISPRNSACFVARPPPAGIDQT